MKSLLLIASLAFLYSVHAQTTGISIFRAYCPPGVEYVECLVNPCNNPPPGCESYRCEPNYCGACNATYYDQQNRPIDCSYQPPSNTGGCPNDNRSYRNAELPPVGRSYGYCLYGGEYITLYIPVINSHSNLIFEERNYSRVRYLPSICSLGHSNHYLWKLSIQLCFGLQR